MYWQCIGTNVCMYVCMYVWQPVAVGQTPTLLNPGKPDVVAEGLFSVVFPRVSVF